MNTNISARRVFPSRLRLVLLFAGPLLFTSCIHNTLSHQALSFNRTVHEHRVEQLLLNVLRASNREPMALTAVTSLSTSNTKRASIGPVSGSFGALATDLYTGSVSGSVSASPNMAITILDDDPDFMRGFVSPVPHSTIRHFLEQGWNSQLLALLLIEEIKNTKNGNFVNDPRDPEAFSAFRDLLRSNLQYLEVVDDQVRLRVTGSDALVVVRSPQSVLYYLGELARIQLGNRSNGVIPTIDSHGVEEPLFLIERVGEKAGKSGGSVVYRGQFYRVPMDQDSRSLQALAFVQQLINLQTKTVAPAPSTLRLVP